MSTLRLYVEGIGLWSPQWADFAALHGLLQGQTPQVPGPKPAAAMLPPNERRRAPPGVLLAVEVAGQAVTMSGHDPASLPCIFASSHGDQSITDYMCTTLAQDPTQLSPIRFHNSVHNAAVGYWTMATGCHAASTALAAQRASFGAGLLEAATQVITEHAAVLLTCSDTAGSGPLGEMTHSLQPFGCALVLAPETSGHTLALLELSLTAPSAINAVDGPLAGWGEASPSAAALPLLALLAGQNGSCQLAAAPALGLRVDVEHRR